MCGIELWGMGFRISFLKLWSYNHSMLVAMYFGHIWPRVSLLSRQIKLFCVHFECFRSWGMKWAPLKVERCKWTRSSFEILIILITIACSHMQKGNNWGKLCIYKISATDILSVNPAKSLSVWLFVYSYLESETLPV